jgi:hypothetical protein
MPSAEGGIAFRFKLHDRRALVEFLNSGKMEIILYGADGQIHPSAEHLRDSKLAIAAIETHLVR